MNTYFVEHDEGETSIILANDLNGVLNKFEGRKIDKVTCMRAAFQEALSDYVGNKDRMKKAWFI